LKVLKEEEESIRVDVHEGCGRVKFYWLLALADARTLKAVVEFRAHVSDQPHHHPANASSTSSPASVASETCRSYSCAKRAFLEMFNKTCVSYGFYCFFVVKNMRCKIETTNLG